MGANPNLNTKYHNDGPTAFGEAIGYAKNFNIIKILLSNGADIHSCGFQKYRYDEVKETYIEINKKLFPIHYAFFRATQAFNDGKNTYYLIKLLLGNGANVNQKDNVGNSSLHLIVSRFKEHFEYNNKGILDSNAIEILEGEFDYLKQLIILLIKHGADKTIKNNEGKTAYDIAMDANYYDIALILK